MPRLIHLTRDNGAAFCEITVMDDRQEALARFYRDRGDDTRGVRREVRQVVADGGGPALLASFYDQLTDVLAARPQVTVLASAEGAVEENYQALAAILQAR